MTRAAALRRRRAAPRRAAAVRGPRSRARARRGAAGRGPQRQRQVEPDPARRRACCAPSAGGSSARRWRSPTTALALDRELPLRRALGFWGGPRRRGDGRARASPILRTCRCGCCRRASKRATLARVAASAAPLWLLDEPLNGLDADGAERLAGSSTRHRAAGGAVLAASHQPLARRLAQAGARPMIGALIARDVRRGLDAARPGCRSPSSCWSRRWCRSRSGPTRACSRGSAPALCGSPR